ncbi:MAG TPA: STAS domain-containing protein [Solirubrobacteraceae bacterium]|nr:STAS domain-containing protein [Solirubrobacteraceae bacterium]
MNADTPTPGTLSISSSIDDGTVRVTLEGELDLASARLMEERLSTIEETRPARLVVDLGRLAFIDSTGLRLLLQADGRARERGGEFVLRPGDANVQRVFEVTGALDVLSFEGASES